MRSDKAVSLMVTVLGFLYMVIMIVLMFTRGVNPRELSLLGVGFALALDGVILRLALRELEASIRKNPMGPI